MTCYACPPRKTLGGTNSCSHSQSNMDKLGHGTKIHLQKTLYLPPHSNDVLPTGMSQALSDDPTLYVHGRQPPNPLILTLPLAPTVQTTSQTTLTLTGAATSASREIKQLGYSRSCVFKAYICPEPPDAEQS